MSRHRFSRARRAGFTIVEMTIVLVVIGLLLSGILKGQELINGAKIRAIVDRQNSIRIAWFEFVDHFGAKPGDFARAGEFIANATSPPLPLPSTSTAGNGLVELEESDLAMEHLTLAGLLRCQQCVDGARTVASTPTAENSPTNQYDGVISIWHNGQTRPTDPLDYAIRRPMSMLSELAPRRLQIHTGPRIPSNILAEVDRKIDDGLANSGGMVFNKYDPKSAEPGLPACTNNPDGTLPGSEELRSVNVFHYRFASRGVEGNCGAGIFI